MEKTLQTTFAFRGPYPDEIIIGQTMDKLISDPDLYHENMMKKFRMKSIHIDISRNQYATITIKIEVNE